MDKEIRKYRLPPWFKVPLGSGENYKAVRRTLAQFKLHTVCGSAKCPNAGECWNSGTATFMILGDVCTRNCGFCAVSTGVPEKPDLTESVRVRKAVESLGLKYVVITSVTRDDLPDGGASMFAAVIRELKNSNYDVGVEVLIPDFFGNPDALDDVIRSSPDILNHNMETVRSLYPAARPQANYERSLNILARSSKALGSHRTKSGVMVGLGESRQELAELFRDLRDAGTGRLTVGQYLQPTRNHLPIVRFPEPGEFDEIRLEALAMGFTHVASGPLVRSSYHAREEADTIREESA